MLALTFFPLCAAKSEVAALAKDFARWCRSERNGTDCSRGCSCEVEEVGTEVEENYFSGGGECLSADTHFRRVHGERYLRTSSRILRQMSRKCLTRVWWLRWAAR
jgi:hypothetical protein